MPAQSNGTATLPSATVRAATPAVEPACARAWLDVDLAALARNAERLRHRAGVPLLPMIKADAYGLGAVPVARTLERLDPWGYGVATVDEGRELRDAGITRPIVVFTPLLAEDLPRARDARLTPTLHRAPDVERWAASGGAAWHLAIDTGMSRAGVRWDAVASLADVLRRHPPEGAFTHFHSADAGDRSREAQERRFGEALAALPARPAILHAENSPALERTSPSTWSVARPGVFLYGVASGAGVACEPVAHLRARVVDLRELRAGETVSYAATWRADGPRRIATLGAGYADGYRRSLGNRAHALVRGRRVPVVGHVTMDMTMIDVTGVPCDVGDVATLLGRDGDATLDAGEVAAAGGLSPYELLAGLRLRLPHRYLDA